MLGVAPCLPVAWHDRLMVQVKLIVAADEPAIFFASVQDAESWMEPIGRRRWRLRRRLRAQRRAHTIRTDGTCVYIEETGDAPTRSTEDSANAPFQCDR